MKDSAVPHPNKQLFCAYADHPGITRAEIAELLGISRSKAGYLTEELIRYGFLSPIHSFESDGGRPAMTFRVNCPITFRVLDLSGSSFSVTDYSADGTLLRRFSFPCRDTISFEENLRVFLMRNRNHLLSATAVHCGVLLPSSPIYKNPAAELSPEFSDSNDYRSLFHLISQCTDVMSCFVTEKVTAIAEGLKLLFPRRPGGLFAAFLQEEFFSVCLPEENDKEAVIRPLAEYHRDIPSQTAERIANALEDLLYLSGIRSCYIRTGQSLATVTTQLQNAEKLMRQETPLTMLSSEISPAAFRVLHHLRDQWFDRVSNSLAKKFSENLAKPRHA